MDAKKPINKIWHRLSINIYKWHSFPVSSFDLFWSETIAFIRVIFYYILKKSEVYDIKEIYFNNNFVSFYIIIKPLRNMWSFIQLLVKKIETEKIIFSVSVYLLLLTYGSCGFFSQPTDLWICLENLILCSKFPKCK